MAKSSSGFNKVVTFIAWLTGVIVSLAVGFGLVDGILVIPGIPVTITLLAGWIVVIVTIIGAVLAIAGKFSS